MVLYEVLDADQPSDRLSKQRSLEEFEIGQSLYEARDFPGGISHLERALARNSSDTVVEVL